MDWVRFPADADYLFDNPFIAHINFNYMLEVVLDTPEKDVKIRSRIEPNNTVYLTVEDLSGHFTITEKRMNFSQYKSMLHSMSVNDYFGRKQPELLGYKISTEALMQASLHCLKSESPIPIPELIPTDDTERKSWLRRNFKGSNHENDLRVLVIHAF